MSSSTRANPRSPHYTRSRAPNPVPPPRLGSTTDVPGAEKQTPSSCDFGSRGCCWDVVVLSPAINGTADIQRGDNRRYAQDNFWQDYMRAPANDSSELACRRDRQLGAQLSPCPLKKPNLKSWGGWRWQRACRGVVCPEAWRHYSPLPTSLSALLPAPPLCCIFPGHTRIPHASRQPCLYHAVGRSCDHTQIGQSARHLPKSRPSCLTRALSLRCILYYPPQCNGKSVT